MIATGTWTPSPWTAQGFIDTNRRMREALIEKGYPVGYFEDDGGHSFLTWSGGMANGLETLMGPSAGTPRLQLPSSR